MKSKRKGESTCPGENQSEKKKNKKYNNRTPKKVIW